MPSTIFSQAAAEAAISAAPPVFADIEAAATRLAGQIVATPLLGNAALDAAVGGRVLLKPETLQRTGSFKFRGAFNKISRLAAGPDRPQAIVAYSSGNHAQGVAAAAAIAGIPALIVMPADAPAIKVANTRSYGAEVVFFDRATERREEIAGRIADERGAVIVPPYDDPDIIAGQGTLGREIALQAAEQGHAIDQILVPCSGGGLVAGCALALATLSPRTRVHSVEPAGFDDTKRSLAAGHRVANERTTGSFCDSLLSREPGELTFAVNHGLLADGLAVTDAEVAAAMEFAFRVLKLVVEPGGAVALAALLSGKIDGAGRTTAVVCSGGNVDAETFSRAISSGAG
jgi:threonine dehydratase